MLEVFLLPTALAVPEVYPDDALGNEKDDGGCSTLKLLSCSRVSLVFELISADNAVSGWFMICSSLSATLKEFA